MLNNDIVKHVTKVVIVILFVNISAKLVDIVVVQVYMSKTDNDD